MKRILFLLLMSVTFTRCDTAQQILSSAGYPNGELSNQEIISGLKEALSVGASNSGNKLSAVDGFFKNAALKILLPEEARQVESTLRNFGLGSLVDKAILSMNRAAEDAASAAVPIFKTAIR